MDAKRLQQGPLRVACATLASFRHAPLGRKAEQAQRVLHVELWHLADNVSIVWADY